MDFPEHAQSLSSRQQGTGARCWETIHSNPKT